MTYGENVAQSRARIRRLEAELVKEKTKLQKLEAGCSHECETLLKMIIKVVDGNIVHQVAQCLDCGVRSFISKKDPSRRNYPKAVLYM